MMRAKQINDRNTLMPRINKDAAMRFVRNSLWESKQKEIESKEKKKSETENSKDLLPT